MSVSRKTVTTLARLGLDEGEIARELGLDFGTDAPAPLDRYWYFIPDEFHTLSLAAEDASGLAENIAHAADIARESILAILRRQPGMAMAPETRWEVPAGSGIYGIYHAGELLYVGRARNLCQRINILKADGTCRYNIHCNLHRKIKRALVNVIVGSWNEPAVLRCVTMPHDLAVLAEIAILRGDLPKWNTRRC